jgi:pyridoxine/pyridoxamine 5'-phosphate oxidase
MAFGKTELLDYMRRHRLAVVSSVASDGRPQSALVGIAVSSRYEVIFDTVSDSRKHANLERDPRAAFVFSGPGERTLQFEGGARVLAINDREDAEVLEVYYAVWPDGRDRLSWPKISYWCVAPRWARYSDFGKGPMIESFEWDTA